MSTPRRTPRHRRLGAPWTKAELTQLGKHPDSVLALRTGRSLKEVTAERIARRIRLTTAPRPWTAREVKLLGTLSDAELSRRFRRSLGEVRIKRVSLKIPPFRPRPSFRFWKPAEIRLLGTMPDADLARKLRRSLSSVQSQRLSLGIPYLAPRFRPWTRNEEALLGTRPDKEVAARLQRTPASVGARRRTLGRLPLVTTKDGNVRIREPFRPWTPAEDRRLGKAPDQALAERLGRPVNSVTLRRNSLGILNSHFGGILSRVLSCRASVFRDD